MTWASRPSLFSISPDMVSIYKDDFDLVEWFRTELTGREGWSYDIHQRWVATSAHRIGLVAFAHVTDAVKFKLMVE